MPARNIYHESVKKALLKDGWTITNDPLRLKWGAKDMYVDLGAEKVLTAEKGGRKIAVEIKSFIGPSELYDIENALSFRIGTNGAGANALPGRSQGSLQRCF
jgi:hypothetical protein